MSNKPAIAKGTRDFLPIEVYKRKYLFSVIEDVFRTYGYQPIETPAIELLSTLTGKYGEEGDRLLFKVLNNGDFLSKVDPKLLEEKNSFAIVPDIARKGLKYDLTVPFARYVVMHQNELNFPFKRYQIQPVWRGDRPQKGRYQEFWQCDADVVGSDSLVYEAEIIQMLHAVFSSLGISVRIKINNRKLLNGIAELTEIQDLFMEMTIAIDKLDKIGQEKVIEEMISRGITRETASEIIEIVTKSDLESIEKKLSESTMGMQGINDLKNITEFLKNHAAIDILDIDLTLARGLNYYTGTIFEVVIDSHIHPEIKMGSISGGGRYDELTEVFGMSGMSGVGISFGADRIYDCLEQLGLFPEELSEVLKILLISFDEESFKFAFEIVSILRKEGISADLYPTPTKLKKQMKYADSRKVPYVGIIGAEELSAQMISLKSMDTGDQKMLNLDHLLSILKY